MEKRIQDLLNHINQMLKNNSLESQDSIFVTRILAKIKDLRAALDKIECEIRTKHNRWE